MRSPERPTGETATDGGSRRRTALIGVGVVLLACVAVALAFALGPLGGVGGSAASNDPGGGPPTVAPGNGSANPPGHVRPFGLGIDGIDRCGYTCRDVTASLTNNGGNPRRNVTVQTDIYAGEDRVWNGTRTVGTLGAKQTVTRTTRVDVGYVGAAKIEHNGGNVTIVTTVRWDHGSATYRDRRNVA